MSIVLVHSPVLVGMNIMTIKQIMTYKACGMVGKVSIHALKICFYIQAIACVGLMLQKR